GRGFAPGATEHVEHEGRNPMPDAIDRHGLRQLVEERRAQVVEVLPRPEYEWAHLPGAQHLPLKQLSAERTGSLLDADRPVIAYCNDLL
ncbi:MAG: rhodanese-like domain-containing protein, partial [Actinobacteria bacterium]|nr:rhodanese-like domain-containing protein [Actinomycetota bacterium]